jgi:hypothetical protein
MKRSDQPVAGSGVKGRESDGLPSGESSDEVQAEPHAGRYRLEWRTELIAVVILSVATLGVAWSGYQAARWGGVQSTRYVEAGGKRVQASSAASLGYTEITVESSMFISWLEAYTLGQTDLADLISERFPDEFKPAFVAWIDTHRFRTRMHPQHPLTCPNSLSWE